MNSKTGSRAEKMARRVAEYMKTPEGKKALEESRRRKRKILKLPVKARDTNRVKLRKTFTL